MMIVACNSKSPEKEIASHQVRDAAGDNGWGAERNITLECELVVPVVRNG